jgi:very-short-patch-repair endonuclease
VSEEYIVRGQRVTADKVEQAKELRRNMTDAEAELWHELRKNRAGLHFRRQQIIDGYIVDFYCLAARLVVEVDGPIHEHLYAADRERSPALAERGLQVVRVTNDEVFEDIGGVLDRITKIAYGRTASSETRAQRASSSPFPPREGG